MLAIRLARVGKRGHATFRVVVTEHTRPAKSGSLEQLGSYDPHTNKLSVDAERVKQRLAHGAQASPTVRNLLIEHKVIEGQKVRAWKAKRKAEDSRQQAEGTTATPTPGVGVSDAPTLPGVGVNAPSVPAA